MHNILQKGNWDGFKKHPPSKQRVMNALLYTAAADMSNTEMNGLEVLTIGWDCLLPTDLIDSIIKWLNWDDKFQMQLVCKTFNGLIQHETDKLFNNEEAMWEWIGFGGMQRTLAPVVAVNLSGKYTWSDIFTEDDSTNYYHLDIATTQQQAIYTRFKLQGIDALMNECLKRHNIQYQIKGMISNAIGSQRIIINELLVCQMMGITMDISSDESEPMYCPDAVYIIGAPGHVFSVVANYVSHAGTAQILPAFVRLIFEIKNPFYYPINYIGQSNKPWTPPSTAASNSFADEEWDMDSYDEQ